MPETSLMSLMRRRMTSRCRRRDPWLTLIVALTVVAAAAFADEEMEESKSAAETLPQKVEEVASEAISDKNDPPGEKQYFIYYNPRAQERVDRVVSAEQGQS